MQELLETFSASGKPLGLVTRDVVHRDGLWHRAANVFLFKADGRLVVQRRNLRKDVCPGGWDLSVAEHLKPGENYATAAARGLREELGIQVVDLEPLGGIVRAQLELPESGIRDYEMQQSFRAMSDAELHLDGDEVAEFRLLMPRELNDLMLRSPADFTPWFRDRARDVGLFD